MKSFYIRIALPLITLFALLILASTSTAGKDYFSSPEPYVRLATLWDAPGVVYETRSDRGLIMVYDQLADVSRLVEVSTGRVLMERTGIHAIRFSPTGQFLIADNHDKGAIEIIELGSGRVITDVLAPNITFSHDESLVLGSFTTTTVVDAATGNILGEFDGLTDVPNMSTRPSQGISRDNRLLAVVDRNNVTKVYNLHNGVLVAEIPAINAVQGSPYTTRATFAPDGTMLAVFQIHSGTTYFFNTDTWDIRFQVAGSVAFNGGGSMFTTFSSSSSTLREMTTGAILNQVYGGMEFSSDDRFVYRFEPLGNDIYDIQIIDPGTNRIFTEMNGSRWGVGLKANNTILQTFNFTLNNTRFIDLFRGVSIEVQGDADLFTVDRNLLLFGNPVTDYSPVRLTDFVSGEVYVNAYDIWITPNRQYVFASDGRLLDVYGPPSARLETMPAPRLDSGVARSAPGQVRIYSYPDAQASIIKDAPNEAYFYIIGQTANGDWLYTIHNPEFGEIWRTEGWIRSDDLTIIEPWDDAPILDPADPLGSLRRIAEEQAS